MSLIESTSNIGKIGIAISVFAISLLVSNASAQDYDNDCADTHVQPVAVRRATRNYNSARRYQTTSETRVYVTNGHEVYKNGSYRNSAIDPDYYETQRIASDYGYKDGFYDGHQAGMERDVYHPENSGDYQKATNGYEDDFGPKDVYRQAYRRAYLRGYKSGWRSVAQSQSYRAERW